MKGEFPSGVALFKLTRGECVEWIQAGVDAMTRVPGDATQIDNMDLLSLAQACGAVVQAVEHMEHMAVLRGGRR